MKKFLVIFTALFTMVPVFAQSDDGEDETTGGGSKQRENAFFMGPKIGGTLTTMTQPNEGDLYDGSGFGFSAGLALKARFGMPSEESGAGTGHWGVGLELKFKQNTVKTIGTDEDGKENANLSVSYFEVPVYAQYYPFITSPNMNSFYVELGASVAGTMGRSPKTLTMTTGGQNSAITYNLDTENSKLKGMDVRPLIGLGYTIPNTGLDINGRFYLGTSELAGNFPCKMNTLEISLAWYFDVCKF